ncbi:MAG: dockerin type I domain-containing protein [Oscillospiraceae bacterium]|nr:dockerin type I domain-containing protein [Oscillospiraceae bacterium]
MKAKKISAVIAAAAFTLSGNNYSVAAADSGAVPVDIDKTAYEYLLDYNSYIDSDSNGVIDETELAAAKYISLDLEGVDDISWITKAGPLEQLSLDGGNITDFSVLAQMKNLKYLFFYKVPISDISAFKSLDLQVLSLEGTNVSDEDRHGLSVFNDYELGQGYSTILSVRPSVLNEYTIKIKDSSIAAFDMAGKDDTQKSSTRLYALSPGETVYEVYADSEKIGEGKIKITETVSADPELCSDGEFSFLSGYSMSNYKSRRTDGLQAVDKNGTCYTIKDNCVSKSDENVSDISYIENYSTDENSEMILYSDGKLKVDSADVFSDDITIDRISGNFACSGNDLYYISKDSGSLSVIKVCSNFDRFIDDDYYMLTDGSLVYAHKDTEGNNVVGISQMEAGKIDVVDFIDAIDHNYALDSQGRLYSIKYNWNKVNSYLEVLLVDENVVNIGMIGGVQSEFAYQKEDSGVWYCEDGKSADASDIVKSDFLYNDRIYCNTNYYKDEVIRTHKPGPESGAICSDDYYYEGRVSYSPDGKVYIITNDKYFSMTNVRSVYQEYNCYDYLYILRTDDTLWQYNVLTGEYSRLKINGPEINETIIGDVDLSGSVTASDLMKLKSFILGGVSLDDRQMLAADISKDSRVNILDIIELIRYLLNE